MRHQEIYFNKMTTRKSASAALKQFTALISASPSPHLAENNLLRLLDRGAAKALSKIPTADLPHLFRLLGSSSFLSDVLIRQGGNWPELFLHQIKIKHKSVSEHDRELQTAIKEARSFDEACAVLRRHKQREYLRIGTRDLMPSVTLERPCASLACSRTLRLTPPISSAAPKREGLRRNPLPGTIQQIDLRFSAWANWAAAS
jgi:glutamine synthetase adenylyltransferase